MFELVFITGATGNSQFVQSNKVKCNVLEKFYVTLCSIYFYVLNTSFI